MDTLFWFLFTAANFTVIPLACAILVVVGLKKKKRKIWVTAASYPILTVAIYGWSMSPTAKEFQAFESIVAGMDESAVLTKIENIDYEYKEPENGRPYYIWKSRGIPYWHFFIDMEDGKVLYTDFETFGL